MTKNVANNNQITVIGLLNGKFKFSHETYGEKFYLSYIQVKRFSNTEDVLPVVISEKLIDVNSDLTEKIVKITGQIRSFNLHEGEKHSLILSIFVRDFGILEEVVESNQNNEVLLDGYICKAPIYRVTPSGREIADVILAVNRPFGKTDYIPCICWGRNAKFISQANVGDHFIFCGRFQSRAYNKYLAENEVEKRIAYEVSVKDPVPVVDEN